MSGARHALKDVIHDIRDRTESGNIVTMCGELIMADQALVSQDPTTCPGCLNPMLERPVTAPSTGRPVKQYRRPKNQHRETLEGLHFAHKAIVAAIEWMERGEPGQFLENALDQTHLGSRFLDEILESYRWRNRT